MIKVNLIWILFFALYFLSFALLILLSYLCFDKKIEKFSFFSHFPSEFINKRVSDVFLYIFVILSFSPLFVIVPLFGEFGDMAIFNIVITCLFGLLALVNLCLIKVSTKYITPHIKLAVTSMSGSLLLACLSALHLFIDYSVQVKFKGNSFVYLIFGIIAVIGIIFMLIIMLNPKLKNWAQLEEHVDGNVKSYARPKYFPLAYSEWAGILISFLSELLFFISLLQF